MVKFISKRNSKQQFKCNSCRELYDLIDHKPLITVPCGHSICSACSSNQEHISCSFCRLITEKTVQNWEIFKRLSAQDRLESDAFDCTLCLDSFNSYDKKPLALVPCVNS
jgi:hypothetical protein